MKKIILASTSPRRKQLLSQIGAVFEVCESQYAEDMTAKSDPYELAKFLALEKGKEVAKRQKNAIIISADTFIVFEGSFIGKPKDPTEARSVLRSFAGKEVHVVTGYAVIDADTLTSINDTSEGIVKFRSYSEEEIEDYIATGEPLDKAGCFAVQEKGAVLIESVSGDYFSTVGLPLSKIYLGLKEFGINVLRDYHGRGN